jgi:uracil-DNA glycosylase
LRATFPDHSWSALADEFSQLYMSELCGFLRRERASHVVYPHEHDVFKAFSLTAFEDVKVVILGQDPYAKPDQAMGLAFSVRPGVVTPRSLRNIQREIPRAARSQRPHRVDLTDWARQGVLLLNCVLTVRAGAPSSHRGVGWEQFTKRALQLLNDYRDGLVFLQWGREAQQVGRQLGFDTTRHHVLAAPHPRMEASYPRGFRGCGHLLKANRLLAASGILPVCW